MAVVPGLPDAICPYVGEEKALLGFAIWVKLTTLVTAVQVIEYLQKTAPSSCCLPPQVHDK